MSGKVRHYYAEGNTARGYFTFYDSVCEGLDRLLILKDGHRIVHSEIIKTVGENLVSRGIDIECLHSSMDNNAIVCIVITDYKLGIIDDTVQQIIKQKVPCPTTYDMNLGIDCGPGKLSANKEEMTKLKEEISRKLQAAYDTFASALEAHDDIEKIYIANMDYLAADRLTNELIHQFFGEGHSQKEAKVKHRFLGAATPIGSVDYVQNLTEDIGKRYFIKGRAGSGKSTMLKKIAAAGESRGFDVEIYHCGFDPDSLDMVIIPEKQIAIFDSTAPHEYFPDRENDEIIDMYLRCVKPGTDETYAQDIERTTKAYKDKMKEAISYLAEAKALQDTLDDILVEARDSSQVLKIQQQIVNEIENMLEL